MNIFVINSGSSSIKYQLFKMPSEHPVCSGMAEKIGLDHSEITHKVYSADGEKITSINLPLPDHETAMLQIEKLLTQTGTGVIQNPDEIEVVGHRVVHGGERFTEITLITEEVKEEIKKLFVLAPLHNPGHYAGITVAEKLFPKAAQLAVFDTAFHQTMPEKAYRYAIPDSFYKEYGIRAYGFHGISHKYVSQKAMDYLNNQNAKIISIHLGNGCSMTAISSGKCIDTSMGLTPLDGLMMGTRSGAIDASVLLYLMDQTGMNSEQINQLLNKESGMKGLTGNSDMRDIKEGYKNGDEQAILAYEMYAYRIKKYIGAYAAALNGLDAIVFTAGVGENDSLTRELVCLDMEFFGMSLDVKKNMEKCSTMREINSPESNTKILVVPTNEELEIAGECVNLLQLKDC
jgi:acetate kinase